MAILFTLKVFARNLLRGNHRRNTFCILFWYLTWGSNPGFTSIKPTYYLLYYGDILCNICLKSGRSHKFCGAETCKECKGHNHTLLYYNTFYLNRPQSSSALRKPPAWELKENSFNNSTPISLTYISTSKTNNSDSTASTTMITNNSENLSLNEKNTILLATALIQVTNKWGFTSFCRALLDSGSNWTL